MLDTVILANNARTNTDSGSSQTALFLPDLMATNVLGTGAWTINHNDYRELAQPNNLWTWIHCNGSCNTNYSFAQVQGQLGLESSGTNNDPQFTSLPYGSTMNSYLNDYSLGAGSPCISNGGQPKRLWPARAGFRLCRHQPRKRLEHRRLPVLKEDARNEDKLDESRPGFHLPSTLHPCKLWASRSHWYEGNARNSVYSDPLTLGLHFLPLSCSNYLRIDRKSEHDLQDWVPRLRVRLRDS